MESPTIPTPEITPQPISSPPAVNPPKKSYLPLILAVIIIFAISVFGGTILGKLLYGPQTAVVPTLPAGRQATLAPKPTTIPTVTPDVTTKWKTYKNVVYGLEFKYPPTFSLTDKLPTSVIQSVPPDRNLKLTEGAKSIELTLWVNPGGFGPFFADKVFKVDYSPSRGIYVVNVVEEDVSKYRNDDKIQIMTPQDTNLQGHNIFMTFGYKKTDLDTDKLFTQILSTFRFD